MEVTQFTNLKKKLQLLSTFSGFTITNKVNFWVIFNLFNTHLWPVLLFVFFGGQAIEEHLKGRRSFFSDAQVYCGLIVVASNIYAIDLLFLKRNEISKLIDWCEGLYARKESKKLREIHQKIFARNNRKIREIIKITLLMTLIKVSFPNVAALMSKFFAEVPVFPTPMYSLEGWIQEYPWYQIIFLAHSGTIVYYCTNVQAILTLYIIISSHIVAQIDYLTQIIRTMKAEDDFDCLIDLHSDILTQIEKLSNCFSIPMLSTEANAMSNFVFFGLMIVRRSEYHMIILNSFNLSVCALYSHFGQQITDRSMEIADALYESCWLEMKVAERKKVLLLIQMAEKPRGVKSGGFYFISYSQFTDVSSIFS